MTVLEFRRPAAQVDEWAWDLRPAAQVDEWAWDLPRVSAETERRPVPYFAILVAIGLAAIAAMHLYNINGAPAFGDDEGTYMAQGSSALRNGRLAHYTYWYDHPPAGWLQIALLMLVPSLVGVDVDVASGRYAMVLYALITAALIYQLGKNLGLRRPTALIAMLLWGLSPLVVSEARQVLLDNVAMPWFVGAAVLATNRRKALWMHLAAGLCFGVAITTKETMALLAPALLIALWVYAYKPTRKFSLVGAVTMTVLTISIYPLFAALKSELFSGPGHVSVEDAIKFQLISRASSGSIFDPNTVAYQVVHRWLYYDQFLVLGGAAAGLLCLAFRRFRFIGVLVLLMGSVLFRGGYLPEMYVVALLPFAALAMCALAEVLALQMWRLKAGRVPIGALIAALLFASVAAYFAPTWKDRNTQLLHEQANVQFYAALDYMKANLSRDTRIVANDAYFNPLVNAGWRDDGWDGPIWMYKLGLDPIAMGQYLPDGWKDVNYIIDTNDGVPKLLNTQAQGQQKEQLGEAYLHSTPVQSWGVEGRDSQVITLRKIDPKMKPFETYNDASAAPIQQP